MRTALVVVAGGQAYIDYAETLMKSASQFFHPTEQVDLVVLEGEAGWPNGTMMRYHRLLESLPQAHFVYMIDADMLMVNAVGPAILPPGGYGITATQHPGYVGMSRERLPFERRLESSCFVPWPEGSVYHCGGFVGGERLAVKMLAQRIIHRLDADITNGVVPVWHDESALNSALSAFPPDRLLSPSYCFPASNIEHYASFWPERYLPKILAVDKTTEERGAR